MKATRTLELFREDDALSSFLYEIKFFTEEMGWTLVESTPNYAKLVQKMDYA